MFIIHSDTFVILFSLLAIHNPLPPSQNAALIAVVNVYEHMDDLTIRRKILPKIKVVFEKNQNDTKIIINVLQCLERTFDKLEKSQVSAN